MPNKVRWKVNTKLSNHDNNRFCLLLWKRVYPYGYMDDWEKLNEKSLPGKEDFSSHLNMEDTTDADYMDTKIVCKDFEIKRLQEHPYLYV